MFDVHATEEEDKLVLLCALDRIGGCTEEQLLRFVVETGLQTQFRFFLALAALKEAGMVRLASRPEGKLLILTPQGRESMELFAPRIRASLQEKLREHGGAWRRRVKAELQMPSEYRPAGSGYAVTLRTLEAGEEIFSMTLTAATKVQAKRFCERWPKEAPYLYQTIMARLGEIKPEGAEEEANKE